MAYGWISRFLWKFGGTRRRRTTISRIPDEIYYEILLKLPVKSLLACKCVCKDWYALISTSQFVKNHHNLTVQKNNPNLMLNEYATNRFYSVGYDSLPSSSSSSVCEINDYTVVMDDTFKSSLLLYCNGFLGSSNGLVCIWLRSLVGKNNLFYLWNPATREYKELPESPIAFDWHTYVCIHGLGYDRKTDDYKLVVGVEAPESNDTTLVQVYTLASNSWKTEKTIPYRFRYLETSGVLVNGNLHWLAVGKNSFSVLSMDISDESFEELQLPSVILEMNKKDMCLGVLQGCLCLFVGLILDGVRNGSEIWEMPNYGIQDSWTKRYVIAHESIINEQKYFRLVQSFEKDKILLLGGDILVLYDSKHGSARELKIDKIPFRNTETYFESLVSLNSGTYVVGGRKRATEETLARERFLTKMFNYLYYFISLIHFLGFIYARLMDMELSMFVITVNFVTLIFFLAHIYLRFFIFN